MKLRFFLAVILYALIFSHAWAMKSISVQALFSGKAVVMIDGERRVLAIGESSPEGVKLIAADSQQATLEVDGVTREYVPGAPISMSFVKPEDVEVKLYPDDRGMYLTVGSINGRSVKFLVDTGATTVAMNKSQAKKLGVRYRIDGKPVRISTASGFVKGYQVRLKSVSLGKIKRTNVKAMVIDGDHPGPMLLGMSFLDGLKIEKTGNAMLLKQRK